ncbi:uncharacterized protein Dvir_GJ11293 [Drosophila virilis]|uniref:Fibrinogen C-terminal domain-containing protein n=2 Tax=Drosophila virilis TaxID=7244 RepID=B4LC69_DROVI|nr:uncharacterized protein Dvir_GJ11293 [Drosophila virilis]
MKTEIESNNNKMEGKDREIKQLQEKLNLHNELIIGALKELTKNVLSIKEEMGKPTSNALKVQHLEEQLEKQKKSIDQKDQQISEIKNEINNLTKKLKSYEEKPVYGGCTPFGDAPGIHKITIKDSFDVLCDSATAGPGWTVIQQRINGKEDFYRDWKTYRAGFGNFDGDFFLGLEKIHRLTSAQPHELYIHMKGFDGVIKYRRYEQFAIAGEEDQYRLSISGKAVDNEYDELGFHNNQKFSTFDRDNDAWDDGNCVNNYYGGWWFTNCALSNLNGKYHNHEMDKGVAIYLDGFVSLKNVKILIRPKSY